jgi:serine/threonine protein kinase
MLEALREMHEVKYVHRDVKLDNFLIKNGTVKIIDFGLSTEFQKAGQQHVPHQ